MPRRCSPPDSELRIHCTRPRSTRFTAVAALIIFSTVGALTTHASASPLSDREFAALLSTFQMAVDRERIENKIPGLTAAFVLGDGRTGKVASGFADVERKLRMHPDVRMLSGSTGKSFTAAVAIKLAEEGVWSLDDSLSKYLGTAPWFARLPNADSLTIRLLLQHRGGIENYYNNPRFLELLRRKVAEDPNYAPDYDTLIQFVIDRPPLFPAGAGFSYTDVGYLLVGLAIERASGKHYYDLVRSYFLDPLGLMLTVPSNTRRLPGLAQGYAHGQDPLLPGPRMLTADGLLTYDPSVEFTAGGFATNSGDLARWAHAWFSGRALGPRALDELVRRPAGEPVDSQRAGYYGLAVRVNPAVNGLPRSYEHSGYIPGYQTDMSYYPELDVAVAFQLNTEDGIWEVTFAGRKAVPDHLDFEGLRTRLNAVVIGAVNRSAPHTRSPKELLSQPH